MNWRETTLEEIVDFFDNKRVPLNSRQRQERQGEFPYYGAQGIIDWIDDYLFDGRYLLVPEDGENLNSRKLPIAFFANGRFWVNNHAHIIRAKKNLADDIFIKNYLNNVDISGYITGAAQPKLSQANMRRITIKLPPLPIQRRIASILSAYDDLIENNTRRIAILEEMARRIYEEWFVKFKFPGHEKVKMVDSELGKIPEGWEISPLSKVLRLLSGYAFKSSDFVEDGTFPLVTIKNVLDGLFLEECSNSLNQLPDRMPDYCLLKSGDILLSLTGNVGRCCIVTKDGYLLNQRVAKLEAVNSIERPYCYLIFRHEDMKKSLERISTGVAQQNLSPIEASKLTLPIAPLELRNRFSEIVSPMVSMILTHFKKNSNLRATRDFLLPKLISGEIDVSNLPEPEEAAA